MTLPKYLESTIKEAAPGMPNAEWTTFRDHLIGSWGIGADEVDKYAEHIQRLKRDICKPTVPISILNTVTLPLSPESEASLSQTRSHSCSLDSQATNEVFVNRLVVSWHTC